MESARGAGRGSGAGRMGILSLATIRIATRLMKSGSVERRIPQKPYGTQSLDGTDILGGYHGHKDILVSFVTSGKGKKRSVGRYRSQIIKNPITGRESMERIYLGRRDTEEHRECGEGGVSLSYRVL